MNAFSFRTFYLLIAFAVLILLYNSFYTVQEGERAIILRMGKIQQNDAHNTSIKMPGLHFKIPLLEQVQIFDLKLQSKEIDDLSIINADNQDVILNYYIKWRISDIPLYFTSTNGNPLRAEVLLEQQVNDLLRESFSKQTMQDLISNPNSNLLQTIQQKLNLNCKKLGMTVVDLRIKQINLSQENMRTIYARMRADQERIAFEHREMGKAKAESIRAQADAKVMLIAAKAENEAKRIMAQGDAESATIYTNAYNQDAGFYAFWRSLDAYKNSFNRKQDVLILRPTGQFFKYFNNVEKSEVTSSKTKS